MMITSSPTTIVQDAQTLLRLITEAYQTYLDGLEAFAAMVPDSATGVLNELHTRIQETQSSMEHDLALFDKAVFTDKESLHQLREQLKIDSLHKLLSTNQ